MQADSATRALLALILVCLALLVARSLEERGRGAGASEVGRYSVTGMRAGKPILVRLDTVSGRVWRVDLRGESDAWVPFEEPAEALADGEDAAAAPAP